MTPDENAAQADLERVIAVLRRRVSLIVLCLLVTAAAAYVFSEQQTEEYTAAASIVFDEGELSRQVAGLQPTAAGDTAVEQSTRVKLLELGPTAEQTARRIKGLRPGEVESSVEVSPQGESNIVDVAATWTSARGAAKIANAYARRFVAAQQANSRSYYASATQLLEREYSSLSAEERLAPQGLALQDRIQSLAILARLGLGDVRLLSPAEAPDAPSSPKVTRNTVLGGLLGLLLGLGLAFLLERLNRKLREPDEAREAFGLPILGTVPDSKAIRVANDGVSVDLPFTENESFRMLRASLRYFNVDDTMRSVVVASHQTGVGKTTVAWNLARVAASSSDVVIVEADLRNPSIAAQHGLHLGPGLSEVLTRQVGLNSVIQLDPATAGENGAKAERRKPDAIVAGAPPPNPAELLESQAMSEVLSELTARYDLVVLDTAPLGVVSDAFPLLRQVDGAIAVVRMGVSTRDSVDRLREQISHLQAPLLGFVANGLVSRRWRKDRYGYGYGYYAPEYEPPSGRDDNGSASASRKEADKSS